MSRVIAGVFGGRRLQTPSGQGTRPTSDRVREALFSTLTSMTDLDGSRFADLYAGSGAVGLEAASRGAARVLLVEAHPGAARAARANIATLKAGAVAALAATKVAQAVAAPPDEPYDVIFADPPYHLPDDDLASVLAAIGANGWLSDDGILVVERSTRSPEPVWPDVVTVSRGRRYGETTLWYGRGS